MFEPQAPDAEQMIQIQKALEAAGFATPRTKRGFTKPPHNKAAKRKARKAQRIARRHNR